MPQLHKIYEEKEQIEHDFFKKLTNQTNLSIRHRSYVADNPQRNISSGTSCKTGMANEYVPCHSSNKASHQKQILNPIRIQMKLLFLTIQTLNKENSWNHQKLEQQTTDDREQDADFLNASWKKKQNQCVPLFCTILIITVSSLVLPSNLESPW